HALHRVGSGARATTEAERARELVRERVELLGGPGGTLAVTPLLGLLELVLEVVVAPLIRVTGAGIQHRARVADAHRGALACQLRDMDLASRLREQAREVVQPLDIAEAHGRGAVGHRPVLTVAAELVVRRRRLLDDVGHASTVFAVADAPRG